MTFISQLGASSYFIHVVRFRCPQDNSANRCDAYLACLILEVGACQKVLPFITFQRLMLAVHGPLQNVQSLRHLQLFLAAPLMAT
jgi:hypothetical protein